ncbi:hypothetical protein ABW99_15535 [Pandoraea thiooxydans]|nr:hypothetical protein ABW99_15535 [Pandoraea thiooxydans]
MCLRGGPQSRQSGSVILVTTHDGGQDNIMTISWTVVMDFTPVFAITTGKWNYSYVALRKRRECVTAIPSVDLLDNVMGVGAFIVDGRRPDRRKMLASKLPAGGRG